MVSTPFDEGHPKLFGLPSPSRSVMAARLQRSGPAARALGPLNPHALPNLHP